MGTLKASEAPMENILLLVAPIETLALKVLPATKTATIEPVTTVEPVASEVAESEINITTSAFAGNNCSALNSVNVFYIRC